MSRLNWLHLSDWHQQGEDFDRRVVRDKLVEDISNRIRIDACLEHVDFVVFSGDLAFSGQAKEYDEARKQLLDPVMKAVGLDKNKLFIVPGNHDLDRDCITEYLPPGLQAHLSNAADVNKWLNDDCSRSHAFEHFKNYREFIKRYNNQSSPDYASILTLKAAGKNIALFGINSSWMSWRNMSGNGQVDDINHLVIGEPQIHDALREIESADVKIAVMHHPFEWLANFDRVLITSCLGRSFHFVLHGHEHMPQAQFITGIDGDYVIIPAGASYDRRIAENPRYTNSYNWVSLDFENGNGMVYFRRWSERQRRWMADCDTYENGQFPLDRLPENINNPNPPLIIPYPGLKSFGLEEKDVFYGRWNERKDLLCKFNDTRFIAVVGASGSGKSSLVAAGLLPRLTGTDNEPNAVWHVIQFKPGDEVDPTESLAVAWHKLFRDENAPTLFALRDKLLAGKSEVSELLKLSGSQNILFYIDQFEEIFNPKIEGNKRVLFIDILQDILTDYRTKIIVTMRDDFLSHCSSLPDHGPIFSQWLSGQGFFWLGPPNISAMRDMIERPAEMAHLEFENDPEKGSLALHILQETASEPGRLALMAYLLGELYKCRDDNTLTWQAYIRLGGVGKVIGQKAKDEFDKLQPLFDGLGVKSDKVMAHVFRRLVHVDAETGNVTRQRAICDELYSGITEDEIQATHAFIERFAHPDVRLLVISSDGTRRIVEVAHELLFNSWSELNNWIEKHKDDLRLLSQLERASRDWKEHNKVAAYLWSDERVVEVAGILERLDETLTVEQREFLGDPVTIDELKAAIDVISTTHEQRASIGVRLALLGDPRPGVGTKNGLPDIIWCPVPDGMVQLENIVDSFEVKACEIAKYPITQAQYDLFVKAEDGYQHEEWWQGLPDRREIYKTPGRQIPGYSNHPAVNVA